MASINPTMHAIPEETAASMQVEPTIPVVMDSLESYETVALYIKEGTGTQMADYMNVLERTKKELSAQGLGAKAT